MIYGLTRIKNEAEIIQDTLVHLSNFCNGGIIVYDDCSTDDTVEICSKHDSVIEVIEGKHWDMNRERAEYSNRACLLSKAKKFAGPEDWFVYIDADERIEFDWSKLNHLPSTVLGIRMKLFDFYITPEDVSKKYLERNWLGPEYRQILIAFRNLPTLQYYKPDQREVELGTTGKILNEGYVKHYGKAISVKQWEDTCDYYSTHFPTYSSKWEARRGRAIKQKYRSDFGLSLINWQDKESLGIPLVSVEKRTLRILIATHHLITFAGSELFTLTLAKKLSDMGNNIIVYTKYVTEMMLKYAYKNNINIINDLSNVRDYKFDVAHVHHNIIAYEVRFHFPNVPILFVSHGVLPFLEKPPINNLKISKYMGVSEETLKQLHSYGIDRLITGIYRNIIDEDIFSFESEIHEKPRTAMILSARISNDRANLIYQACKKLNIKCRALGGSHGIVTPLELANEIRASDIVFTLGRGAIETMLCGRIPIIFDYLGGDGLVTPENFPEIIKNNCSGRRFAKQYSEEDLVKEIKKYKKKNGIILYNLAKKYFGHKIQQERILQEYFEIIEDKIELTSSEINIVCEYVNSINETVNYSVTYRQKSNLSTKTSNDTLGKISISIIIPLYNQLQFTHACIKAILKNTKYTNYEIILVDNGSTDGTTDYIKQLSSKHKQIKIIQNKKNLGFAKACNQGASLASGELLMLLNNDTEVQKNWLCNLVKVYNTEERIGIVGAKLLYPDNTVQHVGIKFEYRISDGIFELWPNHIYRGFNSSNAIINQSGDVQAVTGAAMLIAKQDYNTVGGLDENYPMYFEDIDLNMKIRELGKRIYYCHRSVIIHHEGKSSSLQSEIDSLNLESRQIFFQKWEKEVRTLIGASQINDPRKMDIVWIAPFFNPSGYASEAIAFALGLAEKTNLQIKHENSLTSVKFINNMPEKWKNKLLSCHPSSINDSNISFSNEAIFVRHQPGHGLGKFDIENYQIGRTMFETDRIPEHWIQPCNEMDEIWVPSRFNYDTFKKHGIKKAKLHIIPEGIDTTYFDPELYEPLDYVSKDAFNFLSIFEWTERKGANILLKSYFDAFSKDDNVCLYLRTYIIGNYEEGALSVLENKIKTFIDNNHYDPDRLPKYSILPNQLSSIEMLRLYKSCDCFVLPTRGEGWGRPYMEAMAMALPVIGTNWSGNTEFMNLNNSYLINIDGLVPIKSMEIPFYIGHRWAQPSSSHLKRLMRIVYEHPDKAKRKGKIARQYIVDNYSVEKVAEIVINRIHEIKIKMQSTKLQDRLILWEGSQQENNSLSHVNREICNWLIKAKVQLSLLSNNKHDKNIHVPATLKNVLKNKVNLDRRFDFIIRHQWPPNFTQPSSGYFILIQPWEFGSLPINWVENILTKVDEVWVPSQFLKEVYIDNGIPENRIQVIPNGINPKVFHPRVPSYKLSTEKSFKFLFLGGTIYRKGIDLLLKAYSELYSSSDDVCLVIKDMGSDSFYRHNNFRDRIEEIRRRSDSPEIEFIDKKLTNEELAGIYVACDVLVHPYRGEGFGLPMIEALACGLPIIATNNGPCREFAFEGKGAVFVDSKIKVYSDKIIGKNELLNYAWMLEPSLKDLKVKMVDAMARIESLKHEALEYAGEVAINWSWEKSAEKIIKRLSEIKIDHKISAKDRITLSSQNGNLSGTDTDNPLSLLSKLKESIRNNPTDSRVYRKLAYLLMGMDYPEQAEKYFAVANELFLKKQIIDQ